MDTTSPELIGTSIRKVFSQGGYELQDDIRRYERFAIEKKRDDHVTYARTVCAAIEEGWSLEHIHELVLHEPPIFIDVDLFVGLVNGMLNRAGIDAHFDEELNIYQGTVLAAGKDRTTESDGYMRDKLQAKRVKFQKRLAEGAVEHIMAGTPEWAILSAVRGDVIWYAVDSVAVVAHMNDLLAQNGAEVRVDRYLSDLSSTTGT